MYCDTSYHRQLRHGSVIFLLTTYSQKRKAQSMGSNWPHHSALKFRIDSPPLVTLRTEDVGIILLILLFMGTWNDPLCPIRWLEC